MFDRIITQDIEQSLFKGKIIVLYGPRQVGKTTLVKHIIQKHDNTWYVNCDDPQTRTVLDNISAQRIRELFSSYKLVVIDEAQRIPDIGITLKIIADTLPDVQVIATGSSAFELSNTINEPLTGRKKVFTLYPLSWEEIMPHYDAIQRKTLLHSRMIYGMYPDIVNTNNKDDLITLTDSYLYKDILHHQQIKKSAALQKLLQAIALQVWSEVSYHELWQITGLDNETVERYITVLEQSFIIFRLSSFARNVRNELKKSKKIYFWDLGIRNTIINAFNPLELRNDTGALWENFCITERLKYLNYHRLHKKTYFWRTKTQEEIDYIEEENMYLDAFELKFSPKKKSTIPKNFAEHYDHSYKTIHPNNFESFVW
jgi:predicted AAA+ superfamily ATPase